MKVSRYGEIPWPTVIVRMGEKKNELYIRLLKDDNYLTGEQLIEVYKKKNINIEDLNKQFEKLSEKLKTTQINLAKVPSSNKVDIENLVEEITKIKKELMEISQKKVNLLQYSIEAKIEYFYYMYLAYLVTERLENKKWVKNWKSYEDFEKDKPELVGTAIAWVTNLWYGTK